jgi:peptide/nickel transport system substrate-binding protein
MTRNRNSWRGTGNIDSIHVQIVPDASSRVQALRSKQSDLVYSISLESIEEFAPQTDWKAVARERSPVEGIAFKNTDRQSPLHDARVRRALNLAINRKAIASSILYGLAKPNSQGVLPEMYGFNAEVPNFPYDPAKAKALLAEAGYPNGFKLTFAVRLDGKSAEWASVYQAVVQDLAKINVLVTLKSVPAPAWLQMWISADWQRADGLAFAWSSSYGDAGRAIETVSCDKPGAFFCIPEMVPDIKAAAADLDPFTRRAKLQALLLQLHELAPNIYLFPQIETFAYSSRIQKLPIDSGLIRIEDAVVKQ